jgi:DNA-binding response OmpR family regulator
MDILVVEDEQEIAHLIQLYLEKEGFTVHLCHHGANKRFTWPRRFSPMWWC